MTWDDSSEPLLLTIREACARLRVSKTQFYRLRDAGKVRTVTVGGPQTVRVAVADLQACVARLRDEAEAA